MRIVAVLATEAELPLICNTLTDTYGIAWGCGNAHRDSRTFRECAGLVGDCANFASQVLLAGCLSLGGVSVVVGANSQGYTVVNSHTADLYHVPLDLGWPANTRF